MSWILYYSSPAFNLVRPSSLMYATTRTRHWHSTHQNNTVPIKLRGLNYSPRQGPAWDEDKCKSVDVIRSEFRILTQLTDKFHLYALAECSQAALIIPIAKEMGFQLYLNMWVDGSPFHDPNGTFAIEMKELDSLLNKKMIDSNTIVAMSVGSESYHRRETSVKVDLDYFNLVREKMQSHTETKDIPLTVTEVDKTYAEYPELLSAVDFASVNAFPFFDPAYGQMDASNAVDYLTQVLLSPLLDQCAYTGKPLFLTETGWPAAGSECTNWGVPCAKPSIHNQIQYFIDFYCKVHLGMPDLQYYWFTGIDSSWRRHVEVSKNSVEGHFGIFNHHGDFKHYFRHLSFQCPGYEGVTFIMPKILH